MMWVWEAVLPTRPEPVIEAATAMYLRNGWIDMRALAESAGIGRSTLYRKVGDRDALLGEVIWGVVRTSAHRAWSTSSGEPRERILTMLETQMTDAVASEGLRKLLCRNPDYGLRILTSRHGSVERRLVTAIGELFSAQLEPHEGLTASQLAFAVVRVAESFCYSDILAGVEPDVPAAMTIIERLI
jgi:AcrR family transcriptional regulator